MHPVFADTFYFLALLNSKDARHRAALEEAGKSRRRFVTIEYVLIELGDTFHKPQDRDERMSLACESSTRPWSLLNGSQSP